MTIVQQIRSKVAEIISPSSPKTLNAAQLRRRIDFLKGQTTGHETRLCWLKHSLDSMHGKALEFETHEGLAQQQLDALFDRLPPTARSANYGGGSEIGRLQSKIEDMKRGLKEAKRWILVREGQIKETEGLLAKVTPEMRQELKDLIEEEKLREADYLSKKQDVGAIRARVRSSADDFDSMVRDRGGF
jgi:chromosome segregation ATPase